MIFRFIFSLLILKRSFIFIQSKLGTVLCHFNDFSFNVETKKRKEKKTKLKKKCFKN